MWLRLSKIDAELLESVRANPALIGTIFDSGQAPTGFHRGADVFGCDHRILSAVAEARAEAEHETAQWRKWGRELRRGSRRTMVTVDFRLPDDEPVFVGHYGRAHQELPSAEAGALIAGCEDARGYEVFVPRTITAKELHRVRAVNPVTGWRYMPDAHGRFPRPCPMCIPRGQYGGAKIRQAAEGRGY
ncbi:hypothetical protein [Streptosporangium canum]|uniref:hypothetical protein n=1 Tax=Streptosporangium canum TaxID=324952 RepID=UPI003423E329